MTGDAPPRGRVNTCGACGPRCIGGVATHSPDHKPCPPFVLSDYWAFFALSSVIAHRLCSILHYRHELILHFFIQNLRCQVESREIRLDMTDIPATTKCEGLLRRYQRCTLCVQGRQDTQSTSKVGHPPLPKHFTISFFLEFNRRRTARTQTHNSHPLPRFRYKRHYRPPRRRVRDGPRVRHPAPPPGATKRFM
jgi:hypothetical protein